MGAHGQETKVSTPNKFSFDFEVCCLIFWVIAPHLLNRKSGAEASIDKGIIPGFELFDKLNIEERETWTAELWRSSGNARD
jgi:hypothetical protein